jgi:hypothetical protein
MTDITNSIFFIEIFSSLNLNLGSSFNAINNPSTIFQFSQNNNITINAGEIIIN